MMSYLSRDALAVHSWTGGLSPHPSYGPGSLVSAKANAWRARRGCDALYRPHRFAWRRL